MIDIKNCSVIIDRRVGEMEVADGGYVRCDGAELARGFYRGDYSPGESVAEWVARHFVGWSAPEPRLRGRKDDRDKDRLDLFPPSALLAMARVLGYGASKYGDGNWRDVDRARDRYYAAAMRHMLAWRDGQLSDVESGLPHLAHAACSLVFLLVFDAEQPCQDK
jgi:hypothetical protein